MQPVLLASAVQYVLAVGLGDVVRADKYCQPHSLDFLKSRNTGLARLRNMSASQRLARCQPVNFIGGMAAGNEYKNDLILL